MGCRKIWRLIEHGRGSIAEDSSQKTNYTHTATAVTALHGCVSQTSKGRLDDWTRDGLVAFGGAENQRVSEMRNFLSRHGFV
jgi:hypothetical protein